MNRAARSKPTIKDVAREAGASIKTVSRVMNAEPGVRAEMAERVRSAATALGYSVNQAARHLVSGRTGSIGVVIYTSLNWQWTADLVSGAVVRARARGYGVAPFILEHYDREERDAVLWLAAEHAVDGVILTTPWNESIRLHAELRERGMPFVLLPGREGSEELSVRSRDDVGAETVTRRLLELGHRRLGIIAGQPGIEQTRLRLLGFSRALCAHGLDPDQAPRVMDNYTFPAGYEGAQRLLSEAERPTALVCFSDLLAAGALRAAHERGLRVPADVSIVGMGDQLAGQIVWPPLTTVSIPTVDMAGAAVDLLLDALQSKPEATRETVFATRLIERDSSGPAPAFASRTRAKLATQENARA